MTKKKGNNSLSDEMLEQVTGGTGAVDEEGELQPQDDDSQGKPLGGRPIIFVDDESDQVIRVRF